MSDFTLTMPIIGVVSDYGLASFMAQKRFKKIGIRKVLGATIDGIVTMCDQAPKLKS